MFTLLNVDVSGSSHRCWQHFSSARVPCASVEHAGVHEMPAMGTLYLTHICMMAVMLAYFNMHAMCRGGNNHTAKGTPFNWSDALLELGPAPQISVML